VISKLQASNQSNRKDLDWQGQNDAITTGRCIVKHHAQLLRPQAQHELVLALVPAVDALRSNTCRNALALFQELFQTQGRGMDRELDEIVPTLAKKAGEVSTAGGQSSWWPARGAAQWR
jgi:hypothetical protein